MLVSVVDSYQSYVMRRSEVLAQQVTLNGVTAAQKFGGIVFSQDWPQETVKEGWLYLIIQRMRPAGKSKTQRQYIYTCQWTWLVIGTDLTVAQQGANRGDRYRTSLQIMQNLKEANYPGFCQKMAYSVSSTGATTAIPVTSSYPVSATERVVWEDLDFMPRSDDKKSGLVYNAASVVIVGWEDMQAAACIDIADTKGPQIVV